MDSVLTLAVSEVSFHLFLGPAPREVPGLGPDVHFLLETGGFGPVPARIRGGNVCQVAQ